MYDISTFENYSPQKEAFVILVFYGLKNIGNAHFLVSNKMIASESLFNKQNANMQNILRFTNENEDNSENIFWKEKPYASCGI